MHRLLSLVFVVLLLSMLNFCCVFSTLDQSGVQMRSSHTDDVLNSSKIIKNLRLRGTFTPQPDTKTKKETGQLSIDFWHGLIASFSVIIVSELGDKTFFIAAILAMRHSRIAVFLGAAAALFFMTVLSVTLGWVTQIIPRQVTYYVSTALFAIFGLKMLKEGWYMTPSEGQEEFDEAQEEVRKREDEIARVEAESLIGKGDIESPSPVLPISYSPRRSSAWTIVLRRFVSKIFLESFMLTFLAEWGDRSQLTTIILASRENIYAVTIGGFAGHALCTGFAVLGGRMIAQRISVRTVTLIGGVVFILFALSAFFIDPDHSVSST